MTVPSAAARRCQSEMSASFRAWHAASSPRRIRADSTVDGRGADARGGTRGVEDGGGGGSRRTAATTATASTFAAADLLVTEIALPIRHRATAAWFMSRSVIRVIQAFETAYGQYFNYGNSYYDLKDWQGGLARAVRRSSIESVIDLFI